MTDVISELQNYVHYRDVAFLIITCSLMWTRFIMLTGTVLILLIAVLQFVTVFKRRFDFELTDECIWIEIPYLFVITLS
jgi:hypothetical protein